MDGDIFGAASRLGRQAAEAVRAALHGDAIDPFLPARCLERVFNLAAGVPSIAPVLERFSHLRDQPLLMPLLRDSALDDLEDIVCAAKGTILDRMFLVAAQRRLIAGDCDAFRLINDFFLDVLDRAIVSPRGGLMDLERGLYAAREEARRLLAPIAVEAATEIARRPEARRIGIAKRYAGIEATTDLLGGAR